MSSQWQGEERRGHPRVAMKAGSGKSGASVVKTEVVDLSVSGALLEIPSMLSSKSRYVLRLPLERGDSLELPGEVVRSYVHGFDNDAAGKPNVKYRAAIRFVDLGPDEEKELEKIVNDSGAAGTKAELTS